MMNSFKKGCLVAKKRKKKDKEGDYHLISDETGEKIQELYEDLKIRERLNLGTFKKQKPTTFNEWFRNFSVGSIMLILFLVMFWWFVKGDEFLSFAIQIVIVYPIWILNQAIHEKCHELVIKKLGYEYDWSYAKRFASLEVLHYNDDKWKKDRLKILYAPYYFVFPVWGILFFVGLFLTHWTLIIGGGFILLHQSIWLYKDYQGAMISEKADS